MQILQGAEVHAACPDVTGSGKEGPEPLQNLIALRNHTPSWEQRQFHSSLC